MNKNNLDKVQLNRWLKYILPPVATAILFCVVLIIKGIYPFGKNPIDYYDLSAQIVTYYVHIWDSLHSSKNIFYDCYSALSTSMVTTCGSSCFSPFNLFLLFIKRENILKCMSVFLLIKMMFMSFSMNVFLKKTIKMCDVYSLIFSVLYSFSGFVLMHYTIMEWMDVAAFFPLIMTGLFFLLKDGKSLFYTVMLTISIITGYYISVMVLIYIFLMVGMLVFTNVIFKENKTYNFLKLLISTVAAIFSSSVILIPQMAQTMSSARFTNESSSGIMGMYLDILSNVKPAYTSRWFVIIGISLSAAVILIGMIQFRKDLKMLTRTILAIVIMCAELFFENICLFWHYGSYVHYPIRNGFMITFTLAVLACIYLKKMDIDSKIEFKFSIVYAVISIILLAVLIFYYKNHNGLEVRRLFHILAAFMMVMAFIYAVLLIIKNGKYASFVPYAIVCELVFYGFIFLGQPTFITGYAEEPEMERDSFYICSELSDELDFSSDYKDITKRIKNPDTSLNANYPIIMKRSALSNWTALIHPSLQKNAEKLGYTVQYTRLLDSGGTVFSDALLGINNIISVTPQDEKLYDLIDTVSVTYSQSSLEKRDYYYYATKYNLPFGIPVNDASSIDFEDNDIVSLYNKIYHCMYGSDNSKNISELVTTFDFGNTKDFSVKSEDKEMDITGNKALYYIGNQIDSDDYNVIITANGNAVNVASIKEMDNIMYPAHFNNNCVFIGTFSDEKVSININVTNEDRNGNIIDKDIKGKIFYIDLDVLGDLCSICSNLSENVITDASHYNISFDNSISAESILVPLSYDNGYKVENNNVSINPSFASGLFMNLSVNEGNNDIKISFTPYLLSKGLLLSGVSLILYLLLSLLIKRTQKVDTILNYAYAVAFSVVMLIMYFIPVIYSLIKGFTA